MASRSEPSPPHDQNISAEQQSEDENETPITATNNDRETVPENHRVVVEELESDEGSSTPTAPLSATASPLRADNRRSSSSSQSRSLRRTRDVGSLRAASLSMAAITAQEGEDLHNGVDEGTMPERTLGDDRATEIADTQAVEAASVNALTTRTDRSAELEVEEDADLPGYGAAVYGGDNREIIDDLPQDHDNVRAMQIALRHTESALENVERLTRGQVAAEERIELAGQVRDSVRLVQDYAINAFRGVFDHLEDERARHHQTEQAHAAERGTSRLAQQQYDLIEGQFNVQQQRAHDSEEALFDMTRVAQGLRERVRALEQENRGFRRSLINIAQGIINVQQANDVLRNDALATLRISMPRLPGIPAHAAPAGVALPYGGEQPVAGQQHSEYQVEEDNAAAEIAAAARAGIPVTAWRSLLAHRAAME